MISRVSLGTIEIMIEVKEVVRAKKVVGVKEVSSVEEELNR